MKLWIRHRISWLTKWDEDTKDVVVGLFSVLLMVAAVATVMWAFPHYIGYWRVTDARYDVRVFGILEETSTKKKGLHSTTEEDPFGSVQGIESWSTYDTIYPIYMTPKVGE